MQGQDKGIVEKMFIYATLLLVLVAIILSLYSMLMPPSPAGLVAGGLIGPQQPHVALVRIEGAISSSTDIFSPFSPTVKDYIRLLKDLEVSPFVSAVVLYVNSPGGEAGASYELYTAVESLSEKKPVIVYTPGVLASGAYLASSPAAKIYASPFAEIGSIGVIAEIPKLGGLLDRIGVKIYVVKNGSLKDIGSPYTEAMGEEERRVIEQIVNDFYQELVSIIRKHRANISDDVFNSSIYSSRRALKLGLIDGVGSLDDAVMEARRLAGLPPQAPVIEYSATRGLLDILFGSRPASATETPSSILSALYPRILLVHG